ncbi:hypothetical protein DCCM_4876 [Desulfocucumis palustris]|uniref:Uncharacterized protein n=1 Tax=Desulfocucumis palustris TaxID=1898651 RepID=A0A2L2XP40_9FIRM|nr:hypothetical protein DCCM_4876 [Desulfocucumis palustris]
MSGDTPSQAATITFLIIKPDCVNLSTSFNFFRKECPQLMLINYYKMV